MKRCSWCGREERFELWLVDRGLRLCPACRQPSLGLDELVHAYLSGGMDVLDFIEGMDRWGVG